MGKEKEGPMILQQHPADKEMFYSGHIPGIKAFFKSKKKKWGQKKIEAIDSALEHSDTKRSDIKRVMMRFNKEQMMGYRIEHTAGQL